MTTPTRRRLAAWLLAGTTAASLTLVHGLARAQAQPQAYPSQPIKLIVPYPAGGATDILARTVAQKLQESLGQPAIVENRPGAAGTLGNNAVAKAAPDGTTLLVAITALIQQPSLMDKLPYDALKDFAPVSMIARSPSMLAVPLDSPAKSLAEFVALMKANPGEHNFGSYGAGTSSHIQGALLNMQAGLDLVHVPFQGAAPLITNLIGGQLSAAFVDSASARAHLTKFRPLAVTGTARIPGMPDVPSFVELGYHSFDPYGWFGLLAPAGTPEPIVRKLSEEMNRILRLPDVTARIESLGLQPAPNKPEEFQAVMRHDAGLYAKIIKEANIRLTP